MRIEPGTSLLHYRIAEKLGEGGMGVVWKAVDTTLEREVAIKVLPETLAADTERLQRFEREAKLLASLNHPNIAAVYGLHTEGELRFLAMELIDGEDLAERLARGALPPDDALAVAKQIADALQAAHDSGVIHRDLKPANIMLTAGGAVKVLDFGLAKAFDAGRPGGSGDASRSPTITSTGTLAGTILGTAAYMSPEQAKGAVVDRRADLWAFGVILYEMLTGQRLFGGDSISEVLAAVLMSEPDLDRLPANTPPRIRRLIERCLRRDAGSRLRDAGDARIVVEEALAGHEWTLVGAGAESGAAGRRLPARWIALALVAGLVGGAGLARAWLGGSRAAPGTPVTRLAVPIGPTERVAPVPLLSPDGRTVAYRAIDVDPGAPDHLARLYVRSLDAARASKVPRSVGAQWHAISPDGRWLAFVAPESERATRLLLLKVPLDLSAPPLKLADWPDHASRELLWPAPDTLLAVRDDDGALLRFPADGGPHAEPLELSGDRQVIDLGPSSMLPGGRHLLALAGSLASGAYRQDVVAIDVETGELTALIDDGAWPWYAPSGHLVFGRRGSLLAAPFDPARLVVTGGARSVMDGLWAEGPWTGGVLALSGRGDLLYMSGEVQGVQDGIVWVTRDGEVTPWTETRGAYNQVRISPDGRRVAVQVDNITEGDALLQIRVSDVDRPRLVTVGAIPGMDCSHAVWSTTSKLLAFVCNTQEREHLYVTTALEGAPPTLLAELDKPRDFRLAGFATGDTHVLVRRGRPDGRAELLAVPVGGGEPVVVAMEEERWDNGGASPDGRHLVYVSQQAGRQAVYVRELRGATAAGPRRLVSNEGVEYVWFSTRRPRGGYELVAVHRNRLYSFESPGSSAPSFGERRDLGLDTFALGMAYIETAPDGRFLMIQLADTQYGARELGLVLGWAEELRGR